MAPRHGAAAVLAPLVFAAHCGDAAEERPPATEPPGGEECAAPPATADARAGPAEDYAVVVDAGSSGTRVFVYCWPRAWAASAGVPLPTAFAVEIYPPLLQDPEGVGALVDEFLSFSAGALRTRGGASAAEGVPVWVLATAGLRRAPKPEREQVLQSVEAGVQRSGFSCSGMRTGTGGGSAGCARTLSGEEEGVFMWLARNAEVLAGDDGEGPLPPTEGTLELGGASAQLTFAPGDGEVLAGMWPLALPRRRVPLYTHSYMRFGVDEAEALLQAQLVRDAMAVGAQPTRGGVPYPCLASGRVAPNVSLLAGTMTVSFVGTGSYSDCRDTVWRSFLNRDPCFLAPCTFDGTYQPPLAPSSRFAVFGAFRHYLREHHVREVGDIRQLAREACELHHSAGGAHASAAGEGELRRNACFALTYFAEFLSGLGFEGVAKGQISFPGRASWLAAVRSLLGLGIMDGDERAVAGTTWSRGALIHELVLAHQQGQRAAAACG
eukprot:TRINITY_DN22888_c0_g1_i1.p1 TRINITY_DN22888_c0_g1~~TRINITY_DN22888_c0_g1_i1.p1  ORF type:complete len:494 (+),score=118.90 TRINITY_DN22888_c0_g1_i1:92-1573(+)